MCICFSMYVYLLSHTCLCACPYMCVYVRHTTNLTVQANVSKENGTHLNFKRPTFPLVVAPSGNARSGRRDST